MSKEKARPEKAAVAFLIFKRKRNLRTILQRLANYTPPKVYIISDGPRHPGEKREVQRIRHTVEFFLRKKKIRVEKIYSQKNLGIKQRVFSGLGHVFQKEAEAIFVEDDTIPAQGYFRFANVLLKKYRDHKKIWGIAGVSFLRPKDLINHEDYYFSKYAMTWCLATWRDRWREFAQGDEFWLQHKTRCFGDAGQDHEKRFWAGFLARAYEGKIDSWSSRWFFNAWSKKKLTIIPTTNQVDVRGFDASARHMKTDECVKLLMRAKTSHRSIYLGPSAMKINPLYDRITLWRHFYQGARLPTLLRWKRSWIKRWLTLGQWVG